MRTPSRPGLAALALVTALGLAGCSSDEGDVGNVEDNVQVEDGAGTDVQPSDITTPSS